MTDKPTDATRCYCGEWVAVPHKECLAMVDNPRQEILSRTGESND